VSSCRGSQHGSLIAKKPPSAKRSRENSPAHNDTMQRTPCRFHQFRFKIPLAVNMKNTVLLTKTPCSQADYKFVYVSEIIYSSIFKEYVSIFFLNVRNWILGCTVWHSIKSYT